MPKARLVRLSETTSGDRGFRFPALPYPKPSTPIDNAWPLHGDGRVARDEDLPAYKVLHNVGA